MKSTENNSILVNEQTVTNEKEKKNSFSKFIKEKRKLEKSPSGKNYISTKELAERLNINYEQFRKILNMNKPTQKRDCIIAICAALRLDHKETNEALRLYQYMPFLSEPESVKLKNQISSKVSLQAKNKAKSSHSKCTQKVHENWKTPAFYAIIEVDKSGIGCGKNEL